MRIAYEPDDNAYAPTNGLLLGLRTGDRLE